MSDQSQPRARTMTRNYLATGYPRDVAANYRRAARGERAARELGPVPLLGHSVANLYTEDDFHQHCVFHASEVIAAAAGEPALWVNLELERGDVDLAALDAALAKYGLRLHHAFESTGLWD